MKIETLKHTDVRGKELKYLKVTNSNESYLINVGDKTFDEVSRLLEEDGKEKVQEGAKLEIEDEGVKQGTKNKK